MWFLLTLVYFLGTVVLHGVVARIFPAGNRVKQFLAAGTLIGAALFAHLLLRPGGCWPELLAGGAIYAFLCELYIFLFTFVTSSVSVALLVSKLDASADAPTLAPGKMVSRRLHEMAAAGLLREANGRYHLTPKSLLMVRIYRLLRRFFRHEPTAEFRP